MFIISKRFTLIMILVLTIALFFLSYVFLRKIIIKKKTQSLNLILISVDTLRADSMGIYGYSKNTTPNIDAWAKDATVFNNAYTTFPLTFHSFYTLLTGRADVLTKKEMALSYANVDSSNIPTLTSLLKKNKFINVAFITNPIIGTINKFFSKGFSRFVYFDAAKSGNKIGKKSYLTYLEDYKNSKLATEAALDWLSENHKKKFFIWIHYNTPHKPHNPTNEYLCRIDDNCRRVEYEELKKKDFLPYSSILKSCSEDKVEAKYVELEKNMYDGEVLSVDEEIGKLLKSIKKFNLEENSVIVFYGDHGEGFDHNYFSHGDALYDSGIHIPLIIKVPGIKNKSVNYLIDNTDILPTILELLSVRYSENSFSGKSLVPFFKNNPDVYLKGKKYIYSATPSNLTNKYSIFDGTYKYIYSKGEKCLYKNFKEELYNLQEDPNEDNNLILKQPNTAAFLRKKLLSGSHVQREGPQPQEKKDLIQTLKSIGY